MMTRKDYKLIADIINGFEDTKTRALIANCFALVFRQAYQNFNTDKFLEAANKATK